MAKPTVRVRVDFGRSCAIGPGKVALLEAIRRTGSLSQAARDLKLSYRRAWLLLESLNMAFRERVVRLSTGGKGGGGAVLTPFGAVIISAYRKLEADVARRAAATLAEVGRCVAPARVPLLRRRPLPRSAARGRTSVRA